MANQDFLNEINKRRTVAIISHPDAGKTTVTEKLLLYGGAIQMAGAVKSRKTDRGATSDWMKMEQERGISVAFYAKCETTLMCFPSSSQKQRNQSAVESSQANYNVGM